LHIKFTNKQKEIVMKKKCWFVVIAILLVSQFAIGAAEVPKKAEKLVKKADEAFQKQKYDDALAAYNEAVQLAPEYAAAYIGLGRLQLTQKNLPEAVKNLEKAIELDPESAEAKKIYVGALFQSGSQAFGQRQVEQSNSYFSKLIAIPGIDQLNPDIYQQSLFQLGTNYFMMRQNEESNKYYVKLSEIPGFESGDKKLFIQTKYQIGANYAALRKYKEAAESFAKLIELPELETDFHTLYLSALYMLGLNSNFTGDFQTTSESLTKFLELAKDSTEHSQFLPLANLLLGSSQMTQLQQEVEKIENGKDKLKKIVELAKNKPEIETYLTKAIELNPGLEPAYMHLGNYYYYCNELQKSIETYNQLIEKFPDSPDLDQYKKFLTDISKEKK
jgi:tetratricopeptide (TPR) repeat protein